MILKKKMFLVFSHKMNNKQLEDGRKSMNINEYVYMPDELQKVWNNIAPEKQDITDDVNKIIEWLEISMNQGDVVLVQGDFGATYKVVNYLKNNGRMVVYSTTKREAKEEIIEEGKISVHHLFSHVIFREY